MGFAITMGMFNEPHYLGRTWSAASLFIGAAVYLLVSLAFGYLGWLKPRTTTPAPRDQLSL